MKRARALVAALTLLALAPRALADDSSRPVEKPTAIAVAGFAVGAFLLGAGLELSVKLDYDAIRDGTASALCRRPCSDAQLAPIEQRANAGYVFWGIAGALAVADAVLWYFAARAPSRAHAVLAPLPGGAALVGRF